MKFPSSFILRNPPIRKPARPVRRAARSRKPVVLSLLPRLVTGGAEKQCILLTDGLRRRGYDAAIGVLDRLPTSGSSPGASMEADAARRGVPVFHFPRAWTCDPVPILEIRKFCSVHNVDILHSWLFLDGLYGRIGAALTEETRTVTGANGVEYDEASLRAGVDKMLARWTSAIVANSRWLAARMVRLGYPSNKIAIIPNGIDVEWLTKQPDDIATLASPGPTVGTVGRLHTAKDHATFLHACAIVAAAVPAARFIIAGDGPERKATYDLAARLGIGQRLTLAGDVLDVRTILRRLDVFVLSSINESSPNALLEAMAVGLPCAATDVGGVPEIISHGRNGLLSPPAAPQELAANILKLLKDDPSVGGPRRLSEEAARTVRDRFSLDRMISAYENFYMNVVA